MARSRTLSSATPRTARELWIAARELSDRGNVRRAVAAGTAALAALEAAPDPALRARILVSMSYHRAELGDVDDAFALLDEASNADPAARPYAQASRGFLLYRTGRPNEGMVQLDAALDTMRDPAAAVAPKDLAVTLLNRGTLQMTAGRLTAAESDTREARDLLAAAGDAARLAFMARHNLGYIEFLRGDLPGALSTMAAATGGVENAAVGVPALDRARVLLAAGLVSEAREFAEVALADFGVNKATTDLVDALGVRAEIALADGDPVAARRSARQAARVAARRGNERAATVAQVLELRADALARRRGGPPGRRPGSRRAARRAAALQERLTELGLTDDATGAALLAGEALLDARDADAAARIEAVSESAGRSGDLATRLHARVLAARVQLERGNPRAGLTQIRRGLDDLAAFQARFGSQDLQSGAAVRGRDLARLGLRTAVAGGSPAAILQWLERSRAVSTRLPEVRPPADAALAEDLGALRVAFDRARQAALAGRRDPALDRRVADLRRQIRSRSWTAAASGAVHRPASLATVRRALAARPGTSVLALFHGDGHDHALAVTARGARYRVLAESAHTEAAVRRLGSDLDLLADVRIAAPLRRVARHSLSGDLARLSGDLVEPMLEFLDDGPLLVVDAGPTAATPWGLLPALAGRAVSVTSSVTTAISGLAARPAAHDVGVLVVSGPDVVNGEQEAKEVAYLHPTSTLLTGADATGRAVLDAVPPDGLLHVAAHGHHEPDNPLFSGLLLADGLLFGYDVAPNPALPAHVVLSSCDVGRSHDRPGGEPLGLVAALIRSGVRTVVAATARLADDVAAPLMVAYHQALLDGTEPAAALADAIGRVGPDSDIPVPLTCFGSGTH